MKLSPSTQTSRKRDQTRACFLDFWVFSCSVFAVFCTSDSLTLIQIVYLPKLFLQELFKNEEASCIS